VVATRSIVALLGHAVAGSRATAGAGVRKAAVQRTDVVIWAEGAEESAVRSVRQSLLDQLPDHCHERGICTDRRRTDHAHAELLSKSLGLEVEIVENLEVIGDEADGDDDHVIFAGRVQ
jgi:hypothetical protein